MIKGSPGGWTSRVGGVLGAAVLGFVTLFLAIQGGVVGAMLPALALLAGFLLLKMPLRTPTLALMFVMLIVDTPVDRGPWESPLAGLGNMLTIQLKFTIPIGLLVLTGAETLLLLFTGIYWWRRATGNPIDRLRTTPAPREVYYAAWLAIAGVILALIWGLLNGGQMRWANWQMDRILRLPVWMLFFSVILRGGADTVILGRIIVGSAVFKALEAMLVRNLFPDAETCTSHADSILFATAVMILLILVLEQPVRANLQRAGLLLPLLALGMVANDRRIVWANIMVSAIFAFFLTRWSTIKLRLVRWGLASIPLLALYILLGCNAASKAFKPVQTLRSMVDAKSDQSSNWRELENYDLFYTFLQNPVLGIGLGRPFIPIIALPDVPYELEPYLPHNSILGLWAYTGLVGFTAIWMLFAVCIYFAVRTYRFAKEPLQRVAAMSIVAASVVGMLQAFGDMGVGNWPWAFTLGTGLPLAGKLAIETGAWPARSRK